MIESMRGDLDALRSTVAFLASVIRCGEPFTSEVKQSVDNAFVRLDRLMGVGDDVDPPPAPLVADPKLVTRLIGSGTSVPPPYDEPVNFGGGIESVQHNDGLVASERNEP